MLGIFKPILKAKFLALRAVPGQVQTHASVVGLDWGYLVEEFWQTLILEPGEGIQLDFDQGGEREDIRNARIRLPALDRRHRIAPLS